MQLLRGCKGFWCEKRDGKGEGYSDLSLEVQTACSRETHYLRQAANGCPGWKARTQRVYCARAIPCQPFDLKPTTLASTHRKEMAPSTCLIFCFEFFHNLVIHVLTIGQIDFHLLIHVLLFLGRRTVRNAHHHFNILERDLDMSLMTRLTQAMRQPSANGHESSRIELAAVSRIRSILTVEKQILRACTRGMTP